jgi:hypothetical protein
MQGEPPNARLHIEAGCDITPPSAICYLSKIPERVLMEVAELKTMIGELEARVEKIRDWL